MPRLSLPRPAGLLRSSRRLTPASASAPAITIRRGIITSTPTSDASSSAASSSSSSSSRTPSGFSTINASEISHFSALSSQWWSETGEFALLHRMNPTRVEYIRQKVALSPSTAPSSSDAAYAGTHSVNASASGSAFVDEPEWTFETRHSDAERESSRGTGAWLSGLRCLDVGCGGGLLSESLARLGGQIIGVDASSANIGIANTHATQDPFLARKIQEGLLEYRHSAAERLRDDGEKFDVVCAMEVLEHVDQPGEFMKCLGDMVKPGGHLIVSTISRTPLSQLLTLTMAEDVLRLVTPGTHTYSKFVKPDELRHFVFSDMGGFDVWRRSENGSDIRKGEVGETRGIVYNPLKAQWSLWDGVEGGWWKGVGENCNYMFHARKH